MGRFIEGVERDRIQHAHMLGGDQSAVFGYRVRAFRPRGRQRRASPTASPGTTHCRATTSPARGISSAGNAAIWIATETSTNQTKNSVERRRVMGGRGQLAPSQWRRRFAARERGVKRIALAFRHHMGQNEAGEIFDVFGPQQPQRMGIVPPSAQIDAVRARPARARASHPAFRRRIRPGCAACDSWR